MNDTDAYENLTIVHASIDSDVLRALTEYLEHHKIGYTLYPYEQMRQSGTTLPGAILLCGLDEEADTPENVMQRLRANVQTANMPVMLICSTVNDGIAALKYQPADYLKKTVDIGELVARLRAMQRRELVAEQNQWKLSFEHAVLREIDRTERNREKASYVRLTYAEAHNYTDAVNSALTQQVEDIARNLTRKGDLIVQEAPGTLLMLLPKAKHRGIRRCLQRIIRRVSRTTFHCDEHAIVLTPIVGYTIFPLNETLPHSDDDATLRKQSKLAPVTRADLDNQTQVAQKFAAQRLDLHPYVYKAEQLSAHDDSEPTLTLRQRAWSLIRLPIQLCIVAIMMYVVPVICYMLCARFWVDISWEVYLVVVVALTCTSLTIMIESSLAFRARDPLPNPGKPYPQATSIIAAYLPNEARNIEETIRMHLAHAYEGGIQVILAYNTPYPMPAIEQRLQAMAQANPHFLPLHVIGSTSKAENVNHALKHVTGEFVGIFDADHHPDQGSFARAWRWLSNGYAVVQGHCTVRNGAASWLSRLVAVEFEVIYAVSHPGRSLLHGFGIFGGANGYWRRDVLHEIRLHDFMLTEDIDSSIRLLREGYKIVSDPRLISQELAPTRLSAHWNQRLRWSQGWFQVALRQYIPAILSEALSLRQKIWFTYLMIWREAYTWISAQVIPILFFWFVIQKHHAINWFIPIFMVTTCISFITGHFQVWCAYRLATSEMKRHRLWFWQYTIAAMLAYTGLKNLISCVAQLNEIMGEHTWRVTPRDDSDEGEQTQTDEQEALSQAA